MSQMTDEIKALLDEVETSLREGSTELIRYTAERRMHIAEAAAAGLSAEDFPAMIKTELTNIKLYAATEAVKQADKVDGVILSSTLLAFKALDVVLLALI